jgi:CheY-like chemotaxis protein
MATMHNSMHANSKALILCIDADLDWLTCLSDVLEKNGYAVETAHNGIEGIQKTLEIMPDLIILDVTIPGIDGYQVCSHLKRDPATARIGVLILTAMCDVDEPVHEAWEFAVKVKGRLKGYDSGALEFMTKPVTETDLLQRVKALLWTSGYPV